MKEISKIKKIYKGFFSGDSVSEEVLDKRIAACASCEYNSMVAPDDNLSTIDKLRKELVKPFCTLCKCQLHEKTKSPLEECALYMKGLPKKWLKMRIETASGEINISRLVDNNVELSLKGERFILNYGEIKPDEDTYVSLLLDSAEGNRFSVRAVNPSCGCSETSFENDNNFTVLYVKVDLDWVGLGKFSKDITIEYTVNSVPKRVTMTLTGFVKE